MSKVIFNEKRKLDKDNDRYDADHVVLYINEEQVDNYVPENHDGEETPEARTVYRYDEEIVESKDFTRDNLVNGLIRTQYSQTQEFAILRHKALDAEKYADEWTAYNTAVENAKTEVDKLLAE